MPSTRFAWLTACLLFVTLAAGCGGGGDDTPAEEATESATPPPVAPEEESAEEAESESLEDEVGADIPAGAHPIVELRTNIGSIKLELYPDKAPKTVDNFLSYVRSGFYDGTIFHRVVPGFVIQGGGFTAEMLRKDTEPPIENEADNGVRNLRGTICMARTNDPHSATSQFFINLKDNPPLDFRDRSMSGWGYAVFGEVIEGLDVVDSIAGVPTTSVDHYEGVPVDDVVIETARVVS